MSALVSGGVFTLEQLLPVPLGCATTLRRAAPDTTLGVVFSRGPAIALKDVQDLCTAVSSEGRGMVGVSSYLSPNTVLVIGQGDTLDRLEKRDARLPAGRRRCSAARPTSSRRLHTPLVWQRNLPNRAAVALYKIGGGPEAADTQGHFVRHRGGQLRRPERPRYPDPLGRSAATPLGRDLRDPGRRRGPRRPRRPRAQPDPGDIRAAQQQRHQATGQQVPPDDRPRGRNQISRHAWLARLLPSRPCSSAPSTSSTSSSKTGCSNSRLTGDV